MKNKILPILCIFILLSFIFINSNVFASSTDVTYNGETISLLDLPFDTSVHPYYVIIYNVKENYFCAGYPNGDSENRFFRAVTNNVEGVTYYIKNTTTKAEWTYFNFKNGEWSAAKTTSSKTMCLYSWGGSTHEADLVYSTCDVYTDNTFTEIFFQVTPVTEQPETTTLKPILEKVEMKEPIMTTIVGLAKLLIPFLICLIGFWKAWKLLLKILHKS